MKVEISEANPWITWARYETQKNYPNGALEEKERIALHLATQMNENPEQWRDSGGKIPTGEEVAQSFLWWATGGNDEWEGRPRNIWGDDAET